MIRNAATAMLFGLTLVVAAERPVSAQDVAGALEGRIVGTDSQSIAEAEIEASGPSLQQPATVQSSPRGTFRILSLPVGIYTVRIRAIGYRPVLYERVVVNLGGTTSLGVVELEAQTVGVAGDRGHCRGRADRSDHRDRAGPRCGPISSTHCRSIAASVRSSPWLPQANYQAADIDFRSEGVNIAGGSVWDNAYFVDGVNVTDPMRGAVGTNLPYNFLQAVAGQDRRV